MESIEQKIKDSLTLDDLVFIQSALNISLNDANRNLTKQKDLDGIDKEMYERQRATAKSIMDKIDL